LASIDIGDSLPTLTLKNEKDEDVEVSSLTADKGLVLFLVPKADTREFGAISEYVSSILWWQRDARTRRAASGIFIPTSRAWIIMCTA
jgi:peroxiredoxin